MTEIMPVQLVPIGVVRSPFHARQEVTPCGLPAVIEIEPRYAEALVGVERSSHLHVLAYLHGADRDVQQARLHRQGPDERPLGVFACRSPDRPNPLALTLCRLVGRDGLRLRVDALDLLDGTPVLDLKPYNPGWDGAFAATRQRRVLPGTLSDERLLACLERALERHLGPQAREPEARFALEAVRRAVQRIDLDPQAPQLHAEVNRVGLAADALIGLLGATFASGRIRLVAADGPLCVVLRAGEQVLATAVWEEPVAEAPRGAGQRWPMDGRCLIADNDAPGDAGRNKDGEIDEQPRRTSQLDPIA